jgi:phosphoribosylformimino-5-aminoimidazole carboxamide ribonucleotide (ProFAR) isomerase
MIKDMPMPAYKIFKQSPEYAMVRKITADVTMTISITGGVKSDTAVTRSFNDCEKTNRIRLRATINTVRAIRYVSTTETKDGTLPISV